MSQLKTITYRPFSPPHTHQKLDNKHTSIKCANTRHALKPNAKYTLHTYDENFNTLKSFTPIDKRKG